MLLKKVTTALIFFFFPLFFASLNPIEAHVLKSDGSIGAVIHINPEDDPIAGEESSFFFEFKDKNDKFKPEECDCTVTILKSGEEIYSQPLFLNNQNPTLANASFFFTFPERDIYKIKVSGTPKTEGAFDSFALEYDLRVERESGNTKTLPTHSNLLLPSLIFILFLIPFIYLSIKFITKKRK